MDHSPAKIIAEYLISKGDLVAHSDSGDWPVYVGNLPDGPEAKDDAVGSIDTTPTKDGRIMDGGVNIFHHGVQLLLRSADYNTGYIKAESLAEALEAVRRSRIRIGSSAYRIHNVTLSTGVVRIGQEETKRREMFSVNLLATIQEV